MITTFEQFLEIVPKDGWEFAGPSQRIRRRLSTSPPVLGTYTTDCQCPVTAAAGMEGIFPFRSGAVKSLGIDEDLAMSIMFSADNIHTKDFNQEYRDRLIEAFNLGGSHAD